MNKSNIRTRTCCFFGHRKINETEILKNIIYSEIEDLIINKKVDTFLFGSKSQFDSLCYAVVTRFKEKYPYIKRIYVRAEYPYIDDDYENYLLCNYEDTYYPASLQKAGKAVYVERNYEMINKSNFCVVYYDENYFPPKRKNSKKDLVYYQPKSGTKLAYDYAMKKGLIITNVYRIYEEFLN